MRVANDRPCGIECFDSLRDLGPDARNRDERARGEPAGVQGTPPIKKSTRTSARHLMSALIRSGISNVVGGTLSNSIDVIVMTFDTPDTDCFIVVGTITSPNFL